MPLFQVSKFENMANGQGNPIALQVDQLWSNFVFQVVCYFKLICRKRQILAIN